MLGPEETSEPGPFRFDRTPYFRGILDMTAAPGVDEVGMVKAAQIGWSEAERNLMGYWIDCDPGPVLCLFPSQAAAEDYTAERFKPLLHNTPALRAHMTSRVWDVKKHTIKLDSMSVFMAWGGSSHAVKSRPIRRVLVQEPDDVPTFSGSGGSPISKAEKRVTTYRDKGRSMCMKGGTPTTRRGYMWKWWDSCPDKRKYWVPCPHCSRYQELVWGTAGDGPGIKWVCDEEDKAIKADRIASEDLAYYQCEYCEQAIRDHQKPEMLRRGVWANEHQAVTADGRVVGPAKNSKKVGFHLNGLYSPWLTFSQLAAEWVECQGDPEALMDFMNQRLALPFEDQRSKTRKGIVKEKAAVAGPPMLVPNWARAVYSTVDTQGMDVRTGYFYWVLRAWGYDYRSHLIAYGMAHSFDELRKLTIDIEIPVEGGGVMAPSMQLIDSGGPRSSEVYQYVLSDPNHIKPTKGASRALPLIMESKHQRQHGVSLVFIDTGKSKDLLHRLMHEPDLTRWMPHNAVGDEYCQQMASEQKIWNPHTKCESWEQIGNTPNHYWDCEHQQVAYAHFLGSGRPAPVNPPRKTQEPRGWRKPYVRRGR
jgi:phage terminase large subunit GpA-like protein